MSPPLISTKISSKRHCQFVCCFLRFFRIEQAINLAKEKTDNAQFQGKYLYLDHTIYLQLGESGVDIERNKIRKKLCFSGLVLKYLIGFIEIIV